MDRLCALALLTTLLALTGCAGSEPAPDKTSPKEETGGAQQAFEEARRSVCDDLEPRDCYFEGMKLEANSKPQRAVAYFESACQDGLMAACYDLAVLHEEGKSVARDLERARQLYERACQSDAPDATACNNLAVLYQKGRSVKADQKEASELYRRSCELGSMLGCRNLARRYLEGKGVEKSPQRAAALLEKACQLGHPEACPQLTYIYAQQCLDDGTCDEDAIDPDRSIEKLEKICKETQQPQACLGYGFLLEAGYGQDKKDPAGAALQYDQACKAGVSAGCNYLANLYRRGEGVEQDLDQAVELYNEACEDGFTLSCHTLGVMHLRGRSLPPDPTKGYEYIRKACEGGRTPSCTALEFQCFQGEDGACPDQ